MRPLNSVSTPSVFTRVLGCSFIAVAALSSIARADITLDPLFRDHAVLQRDRSIPVIGSAKPGEAITVTFGSASAKGAAGKDGRFTIVLPPMPASLHARELVVQGTSGEARVKDVLVGEVWFCSGQSNMEWSVNSSNDAKLAKSIAAKLPIRSFKAPHVTANRPAATVAGEWSVATADSVGNFTAIGFWFAVDLSRSFDLEIPIGLVDISWGGTRIEPWIPLDSMAKSSFADTANALNARINAWTNDPAAVAAEKARYDAERAAYWDKVLALDVGGREHWVDAVQSSALSAEWKSTQLPAFYPGIDKALDRFDGAVWFTREFEIPADKAGSVATLELGPIDDSDCVWIDGKVVGTTVNEWSTPRGYALPSGLSAGKHRITICVLDTLSDGGFRGNADSMAISFLAKTTPQRIALAGTWNWRVGGGVPAVATPALRDLSVQPGTDPSEPAAIYNAMMAPCINFPVRGTLWYQGESNAGEFDKYERFLPLLMSSWREKSGNPDMAWGVVQLAGFMAVADNEPAQGGWAFLRRAQERGVNVAGNAGLASAIDLGDAGDIHPKRKREVADRLAAWARNTVYGEPSVAWQGPTLVKVTRDGSSIVCEFAHADGMQASGGERGGELGGFALIGADGKAVWAKAKVDGTRVIIDASSVADAAEVAYAWQNNPHLANLYNGAGLPAIPFREPIAPLKK